VRWIEYKGARILYADYSGLSEEEHLTVNEEFKSTLIKQPPGSVVTLTNVANTRTTEAVNEKYKELIEHTAKISKGAAAIGITGFKKALATLLKRDLYWANSLEDAKEWLAEQARKR
jgi:hypothetical protein